MIFHSLADILLLCHFAFILFAMFGAFLCVRWHKVIYWHLAAVLWAVLISWFGWQCPLTPLENWLREKSGLSGPTDGFINYYIGSIVYPQGFSHSVFVLFGILLLVANVIIYLFLYKHHNRNQR